MAQKKKTSAKQKATPKRRTSKSKRKATQARGTKATSPAVGTVIEKTFKGKVLKVTVTEDGFRYGGKVWRSLTAIAREVTGYKAVSGPAFFGLTKRSEKGGAK